MKTLSLFFALAVTLAGVSAAPRPNILYLYVDDMGWGSIGPNGQADRRAKGVPHVRTPNLDRLAAEGINFTRAYGCTVCSPARSSQQTGFHQGHTFADRNDPNNAKKAIRTDDVTMGDTLAAAGYVTGYWGKWGYGGSKDQVDPKIENLQTLPTSHGYRFVLAELHHVRAHTFFQPTLWSAPASKGATGGLELIPNTMAPFIEKTAYPDQPSNHRHPDYPETGYCDDAYAFAALDFVREQSRNFAETGQPFFGLLAVQIPHAPFDEIATLPEWDSAYREDADFESLAEQSRQWAAMVTRIDAHFGNLLAALEDPNGDGDSSDSVAENTLVIFMSDNGGPGGKSNGEFDANGGLRGNKGSIYEGGIRVPTLMKWPERINEESRLRAGSQSDLVIDVTDLLPTFCDLAGCDSPVGLDGVSLAPILLGSGERRSREFLIHEAGRNRSIIRGNHKLVWTPRGLELYDLEADPAEEKNLASTQTVLAGELEALLLGERVNEPAGFANTYHRWTGKNGAATSDPDHWSDYEYANAGITYQSETGSPRVSWSAVIESRGKKPAIAKGDADLEFLGLEIRGGKGPKATQELQLDRGVNLLGRNEIRLAEGGILTVNGGRVSSLRWIDVRPGAVLQGSGEIDATVYNAGTVSIATRSSRGASVPGMWVKDSYREKPGSQLEIGWGRLGSSGQDSAPVLTVSGQAHLAGKLVLLDTGGAAAMRPGQRRVLLTADSVKGSFSNPDDLVEVESGKGARFKILYREGVVLLEALPPRGRPVPST